MKNISLYGEIVLATGLTYEQVLKAIEQANDSVASKVCRYKGVLVSEGNWSLIAVPRDLEKLFIKHFEKCEVIV